MVPRPEPAAAEICTYRTNAKTAGTIIGTAKKRREIAYAKGNANTGSC
jgi:hypothetical protein